MRQLLASCCPEAQLPPAPGRPGRLLPPDALLPLTPPRPLRRARPVPQARSGCPRPRRRARRRLHLRLHRRRPAERSHRRDPLAGAAAGPHRAFGRTRFARAEQVAHGHGSLRRRRAQRGGSRRAERAASRAERPAPEPPAHRRAPLPVAARPGASRRRQRAHHHDRAAEERPSDGGTGERSLPWTPLSSVAPFAAQSRCIVRRMY